MRARHRDGLDISCDMTAFDVFCDFLEVRKPAVGATAKKCDLDWSSFDRLPWLQFHVLEGFRERSALILGRRFGCQAVAPEMETAWPGLIPQVTVGSISPASKLTTSSYSAVRIGGERLPTVDCALPFLALWAVGTTLQVGEVVASGLT